jgi:HK97 family phage portal protein
LAKLFEQRASLENPSTSLSDPANWLFHAFGAQPTTSNITVTERNATQITAFWSAVNTISDTLGEMPLRLIQNKDDGTQEIVRGHPSLQRLKFSPNPMMSAIVFKSTVQAHVLTWGNGYVWIKRNAMQEVNELWPLLPQDTTPVVKKDGTLVFKSRIRFDNKTLSPQLELPSDQVIHVPALSRNGVQGMSIIAEQREMLGHALGTQQFGSRFFANGAHAGGLVSFPGKLTDPEKVRTQIEKKTSNENAHRLLVLDGDAKYQQFTVPPDDAQFLQTREFSVDEVGRMFRLPLHFLNKMGQATFNNLEMMGTHFVQFTMMPWIIRWEQELTRKLLSKEEIANGFVFKFNVSSLIRGDIKTRSEVHAKGIQNGWVTRNEVRALEDMNPLDGLDDPLVPLNLKVVGADDDTETDTDDDTGTDDDGDNGNAGDDDTQTASMFVLAKAAAERIANKEAIQLRRIFAKAPDDAKLAEQLESFYNSHREMVKSNLAFTDEQAEQYCIDHGLEIFDARATDQFEDVLIRWQTEGAAEIATKILEKVRQTK